MEPRRYAGEAILFDKPYRWMKDADGKLTLRPAPRLSKARTPDAPFTWDHAKAAVRRLATRS
ncbi:hypothetical protein OG819_42570 [Streptomyces sp. NBC_01549]|uniref:hypothetical protein n=1 Tax=Streptomyces sp. NBC_01549 TaxID=2975874 RepID=UPI0022520477|nr:hypothetical protein [Streptomyces sp. NBC_01549]MCX4596101.1 hypothetical protein [Streptomyces sp. NBC_01549]